MVKAGELRKLVLSKATSTGGPHFVLPGRMGKSVPKISLRMTLLVVKISQPRLRKEGQPKMVLTETDLPRATEKTAAGEELPSLPRK